MSLTVNAKTYTGDAYAVNSVTYVGPAHTFSVKDLVRLLRQPIKAIAGVFSGLSRTEFRLTRTVPLTGALTPTHESRVLINVEVPVGMAPADVDTLLNDAGSWLSSASAKTHVKGQIIAY